jgi:hypothetical protein
MEMRNSNLSSIKPIIEEKFLPQMESRKDLPTVLDGSDVIEEDKNDEGIS